MKRNAVFGGGRTKGRTVRVWAAVRQRRIDANAATRAATANNAARTQASFSRDLRRAMTGAGSPAAGPPSAPHFNSNITSCAVCQRSSGSFARHVFTTRSNAGGVIGEIVDIGG